MITIDRGTVFLNLIVTIFICILFLFVLWYQHKNRYHGLFLILSGYILNLFSAILIFLRGTVDDFSSIVLSNSLTMIAVMCTFTGFEKFIGVRSKYTFYYLYLLLFLLVQMYFTWIIPNMAARNVNIATGHIIFSTSIVYLLFFRTPQALRYITKETGFLYGLFVLVNIVRFFNQLSIVPFYTPENPKLMNFDLFILLLYQIFIIATGFVITYMVNKRLKLDILNDEKEIMQSRNILKNLFVNLQTEYENGKINLATQIDNNLTQSLAGLKLNLGMIKKKLTTNLQIVDSDLIGLVEQTYNQAGITIERSLSMMNNIRNEILYLYGIEDAIRLNLEDIQNQTNIVCNLKFIAAGFNPDKKQSFTLFSLYQDVIAGIVNQNTTDKIEVELITEYGINRLDISITGRNIELTRSEQDENSQIAVLKEKVTLANGVLEVIKLDDSTTVISIRI